MAIRAFFLPLLALAGLLAGCATGSDPWSAMAQTARPVVAAPDVVNMRIAEATERTAKALDTLALVDQARTPVDTSYVVEDVPEELKQTVTVTWTGPIEGLAALLADVSGYSFASIGAPPPAPVIVSVEVTEQPVMSVLRSLGLQAGRTADISVNANERVIEVRYVPTPAV
ncbi:MAG: DotD/TraH family lipoprotein [Pseudomonadota bacterium]|nr:DotD/TraH family lipoprotein [Pseudomonadota bacterium]